MDSVFHETFTEVNYKTELKAREPKISEHLGLKNRIPLGDGFIIYQNETVDLHIKPQRPSQNAPFEVIRTGNWRSTVMPRNCNSSAIASS